MTIEPYDAVRDLTPKLTPVAVELPGVFSKAISAINTIHRVWRYFKKAKVMTHPVSFSMYIMGCSISALAGDSRNLKIAAQAVLIALRIVNCVEHYLSLQIYYNDLCNELSGRAIVPLEANWKKPGKYQVLSPSSRNNLDTQLITLWHRTKRVACLIAQIVSHLFEMSLCMLDASGAFTIDNEHCSDNVNLIIFNGVEIWNKLTTDIGFLAEQLEEYQEVIDPLLESISHSPLRTSHFLAVCRIGRSIKESIADGAEWVQSKMQHASETAGESAKRVFATITDSEYKDPALRFIDSKQINPPHWVK